jgi:hypothetical protein
LRNAALSNHFCVFCSICETLEIALGRLSLPLRLPSVGYPLLGNQTKTHSAAAAPGALTMAVVATVVVLAMNLPPVNSALLTRLAALADELFLFKLVVPDGTAELEVSVRLQLLPLWTLAGLTMRL